LYDFYADFEHKALKNLWISGTDLGDEGKFFFLSNGRNVDELGLIWSEKEPNNAKKPDSNETENCMAYQMSDNLKFFRLFDSFCSSQYYFICQIIQNPTTSRRRK